MERIVINIYGVYQEIISTYIVEWQTVRPTRYNGVGIDFPPTTVCKIYELWRGKENFMSESYVVNHLISNNINLIYMSTMVKALSLSQIVREERKEFWKVFFSTYKISGNGSQN
jgi:hypothetical protein